MLGRRGPVLPLALFVWCCAIVVVKAVSEEDLLLRAHTSSATFGSSFVSLSRATARADTAAKLRGRSAILHRPSSYEHDPVAASTSSWGGSDALVTPGPCSPHFRGAVTVSRGQNGRSLYKYYGPCLKAMPANAVAVGSYDDLMTKHGWGEVTLKTSGSFTDLEQAYAAGYLEGSLTHMRMHQIIKFIHKQHANPKVMAFLETQDHFLRQRVSSVDPKSPNPEDAFWYNVALVLAQLDGMLQGYNDNCGKDCQLSKTEIWLMNSDGDVLDIERAVRKHEFKRVVDMTRAELIELVSIFGHCSALIKWTGQDLFVGHTTWDDYSEMNRIYKHYEFHYHHPSVHSRKSSHSSYPGFITSSDDYYVLDSGLVVLETTLNILNEKLFSLLDPSKTVLTWVRTLVSNRMSKTGADWVNTFKQYNSGTYNDQWAIVDYNKFTPGAKTLKPGLLWILEQIPGYIEIRDVTDILQRDTYWASYNRPFFNTINAKSMYKHYTDVHGEMFSYRDCPRAKIFHRDHKKVTDLIGMQRIMMYNDWQHDPFSEGCPGNAIAARFDIQAPKCSMSRLANGATDAKLTNFELAKSGISSVIGGPSHDQQPPFSWDHPMFKKQMHDGQPVVWNFPWVEMRAKSI